MKSGLLRMWRAYHGLSQRQLAKKARMHPQRVWRLEHDLAQASREEAIALATALIFPDCGSGSTNRRVAR